MQRSQSETQRFLTNLSISSFRGACSVLHTICEVIKEEIIFSLSHFSSYHCTPLSLGWTETGRDSCFKRDIIYSKCILSTFNLITVGKWDLHEGLHPELLFSWIHCHSASARSLDALLPKQGCVLFVVTLYFRTSTERYKCCLFSFFQHIQWSFSLLLLWLLVCGYGGY